MYYLFLSWVTKTELLVVGLLFFTWFTPSQYNHRQHFGVRLLSTFDFICCMLRAIFFSFSRPVHFWQARLCCDDYVMLFVAIFYLRVRFFTFKPWMQFGIRKLATIHACTKTYVMRSDVVVEQTAFSDFFFLSFSLTWWLDINDGGFLSKWQKSNVEQVKKNGCMKITFWQTFSASQSNVHTHTHTYEKHRRPMCYLYRFEPYTE